MAILLVLNLLSLLGLYICYRLAKEDAKKKLWAISENPVWFLIAPWMSLPLIITLFVIINRR